MVVVVVVFAAALLCLCAVQYVLCSRLMGTKGTRDVGRMGSSHRTRSLTWGGGRRGIPPPPDAAGRVAMHHVMLERRAWHSVSRWRRCSVVGAGIILERCWVVVPLGRGQKGVRNGMTTREQRGPTPCLLGGSRLKKTEED